MRCRRCPLRDASLAISALLSFLGVVLSLVPAHGTWPPVPAHSCECLEGNHQKLTGQDLLCRMVTASRGSKT
jgi:hypothetical protein